MKTKSIISIICCLVMVGMLSMPISASAKRVFKYGHNTKADQPTGIAAERFAELVKEKTNGEIEIQVFPANQLGKNRQMIENVQMGAQDFATLGLAGLGYIDSNYMMMQIPYVFRSQDHIHKVLQGSIGAELKEGILKNKKIVLLAQNWDRMTRHVAGNKPIKTVDDLKGYKIRAGVLPPIAGFRALGASPVKIPLNEMYIALQQGVADGAELPIDYFYNYSIYEVAKYLNLTYHTYGTQFLATNKRLWDSLSAKHQKALQEAADEAGAFNNKMVNDLQADFLKKLEDKGMEIVKTDVDQLRSTLIKNMGSITKNWPGTEAMYKRIQAVK